MGMKHFGILFWIFKLIGNFNLHSFIELNTQEIRIHGLAQVG